MPAAFDILTRRRLPSEEVIDLWVHSPTGSDTAAGDALAPLASTEEALGRVPSMLWGRRAVVHYLAGHSETLVRPLFMPPILGGGHIDDVAIDAPDPSWDYLRPQVLLQAEPVTVEDITGVITLADATSTLVKVTDASKAWTPNEHVGRALINPGAVAEHGMIWANTATELFVSSVGYSGGALRIVERDATLTIGDPASFVLAGLMFSASLASIGLVGLNLYAEVGAGPAVDIASPGAVSMLLCEVRGGFQCRSTGQVTADACYFNGGSYAPNGGTLAVRQSFLSGMLANFHAVTGQYDLFGSRIDGCGAMGHGGTSNPLGGFRIDNCWIANGTGHGVLNLGGTRSRVTNTRIDACAGDAIRTEGPGYLSVQTVVGTGSAGYGCWVDVGAHVVPSGPPTVAGASGEVRLGGAAGATYNWSQAPQVDAARLCRFGA
jgi:hypothetical protein